MQYIKSIKINDTAYEIAPRVDDAAAYLSAALTQVGCTAEQMTEALRNISHLLAQVDWASNEITAIKDNLADLHYNCEGRDGNLSARIDLCEYQLSELRSVMDAKPENPKQKSDLEIFSRIVPCDEFLKIEGNMFLD